MSPDELAAAARERLDAAMAAGSLTPRPSPEAIRLVADAISTQGAPKPSGESG